MADVQEEHDLGNGGDDDDLGDVFDWYQLITAGIRTHDTTIMILLMSLGMNMVCELLLIIVIQIYTDWNSAVARLNYTNYFILA